VHVIPIPLHPYFAGIPSLDGKYCPRALALYRRIISLPLYPALTEQQLAAVVDAVKAVVHAHKKRAVSALHSVPAGGLPAKGGA
jgi:dTDP-4-amino-4,6-dideoxygalactose transaminase